MAAQVTHLPHRQPEANPIKIFTQIHKSVLEHENNALTQVFGCNYIRKLQLDVFVGLHFSLSLN